MNVLFRKRERKNIHDVTSRCFCEIYNILNQFDSDTVGCDKDAAAITTESHDIEQMLCLLQWIDGPSVPMPEWHFEWRADEAAAKQSTLQWHDCKLEQTVQIECIDD